MNYTQLRQAIAVATLAFPISLFPSTSHAGCCDCVTHTELDQESSLIVEGRVMAKTSHRLANDVIVTDVTIEPIEAFKGDVDEPLTIQFLGGQIGSEKQFSSQNPSLALGKNYILRLVGNEGNWRCLETIAKSTCAKSETRRIEYRKARMLRGKPCNRIQLSTTDAAFSLDSTAEDSTLNLFPQASSLTASSSGYSKLNGVPGRFTNCDDGSPILYQVDTELLPSGISRAEALQAVEEALGAWSAVSGLTFQLEDHVNFGKSAANMNSSGERLFLQLHAKYYSFPSSSNLGIGGGGITSSGAFPNGGIGGNVAGQEFQKRTKGYIVLNHRSSTMRTYSTFVEVITHEIGHALGLKHSSESSNESNSTRKNAIMYYRSHADGRGASLRAYDIDHINVAYSANNMPPTGHDRIMYAITGNPQPTGIGVDRITVSGSDRETPASISTEVILSSAISDNGSFSAPGNATIAYTPDLVFDDVSLSISDIENGVFYDKVFYRISDGVNKSPHYSLRIVGMKKDTTPADGLPDSWMSTHFGATSAAAVVDEPHHPDADPDHDGLSNRIEFAYGSDPNDFHSGKPSFRYDHKNQTARWESIPFMPYILECSNNLTNWTTIRSLEGSGSELSVKLNDPASSQQFYRIRLQP